MQIKLIRYDMENYRLSNQLIKSIKNNLSDNQTVASYLMRVLPIGREAIYRRIRGEIPFTFPEITTIANDLNISIDNIVNIWDTNKLYFEFNIIEKENSLQNYILLLERQILLLDKMKSLGNISLTAAFNSMPYSFFLEYELISSFQLYKYVFHMHKTDRTNTFSDFKISEEIKALQKKCSNLSKELENSRYIIDRRMFTYLVEDISQFYEMKLIDTEEKDGLKNEIITLLKNIETLAVNGKNKVSGKSVGLYLSNIHFDTSYALYESSDYEIAHFRLFSINSIRTNNKVICERQKDWLETLILSSTRITTSNAILRKKYFKSQHDMVAKILK